MDECSRRRTTAFAAALVAACAAIARAETITVNSFEDRPDADLADGVCDADLATPGPQCTLRAAVMHANATPGADTIQILAGTYRLTIRDTIAGDASSGDLDLTDTVTIAGAGAATTIIDSKKMKHRAFDVPFGGNALITGLTIVNGRTPRGESGGAIRNSGAVGVGDCVLRRCKAADDAGGFDTQAGDAILFNVWIDACSAKDDGGGIDVDGGMLSLDRCTISKCKAKSEGGGLEDSGQIVSMTNCTISGNSSKRGAGGISLEDGGTLTISGCTVAFNKGKTGGGISVTDEALGLNTCTVENSIFASNRKANADRFLTSLGGNVDSAATCGFDHPNTNPLLLPLAQNGGPTPTHALDAASPAAALGTSNCHPVDQRGLPRGVPCDSGAFEILLMAK